MRIRLETREFNLVASGHIQDFNQPPTVILYGTRTFANPKFSGAHSAFVYVECLAATLIHVDDPAQKKLSL